MDYPSIPDIVSDSTMKQTAHKRYFHLRRFGLFSVLLVALFLVQNDAGALPSSLTKAKVLSYATEMSRDALLSGTNAARSAQGFGAFTLNTLLNSSAQAKAQDLVSKDYWAHVSPDGTQPWYFFSQAGYSYTRAGENLAYGFSTSQGTVDGWMNSPSHRANILGDYTEVGFGIVNAPDYQSSGQQTIVVAHYGTPPTPALPTTPVTPSSPSLPASLPTSTLSDPNTSPPNQAEQTPTIQTSTPKEPTNSTDTDEPGALQDKQPASAPVVQTATPQSVSVLSMMASRNVPITALVSLMAVIGAVAGYALTHRAAFQHAVTAGEHFALTHPGIDMGIVATATALILLTTYGQIG